RARIVPGLEDVEEAFSLHNIEDMDNIMNFIDDNKIQEAVIVGTGFIGLETAENLRFRDIGVTVVQRNENIYGHIEPDIVAVLHQEMEKNGIDLKANAEVERYEDGYLYLTNNEKVKAPLIIQGIGLNPNTEFLKDSGITMTESGLIPVNEYGQTN